MRILDLFSGAGGCAVGYHRTGFEVVGVDLHPQPNYPFDFVQMDALEALRVLLDGGEVAGYTLADFDAIHASPPCQARSSLRSTYHEGIEHFDLVPATIERLEATGLPYVVENVEGTPMDASIVLCGSMFGLDVRRHRLFKTNFPVMSPPCSHGQQVSEFEIYHHGEWKTSNVVPVFGSGGGKAAEHWATAMGIDWMTRKELAQAIPPAYTELIGDQLARHIKYQNEAAA